MEKKAIDDARVKMAATEAEAERNRINEEKRLMEKIETGGGKFAASWGYIYIYRCIVGDDECVDIATYEQLSLSAALSLFEETKRYISFFFRHYRHYAPTHQFECGDRATSTIRVGGHHRPRG